MSMMGCSSSTTQSPWWNRWCEIPVQTVALSEYLAWTSCLLTLSYSSSGQGMAGHTDGPLGSRQRTAAVLRNWYTDQYQ